MPKVSSGKVRDALRYNCKFPGCPEVTEKFYCDKHHRIGTTNDVPAFDPSPVRRRTTMSLPVPIGGDFLDAVAPEPTVATPRSVMKDRFRELQRAVHAFERALIAWEDSNDGKEKGGQEGGEAAPGPKAASKPRRRKGRATT